MNTLNAATHFSRVKHATAAALGLAALSLFAISANATTMTREHSSTPQVSVDFKDLDLSKHSDAKRLYQRLRLAASEVCVGYPHSTSALKKNTPRARCENAAVANAVETIGDPNLTALYQAKSDVKLAQSKRKIESNT
jgi:UrcA family protein